MTRATVAAMKSEAKRFIAALDKVDWNPAYDDDKMPLHIPEHPKHGHLARIRRASLTLCQFLAEFRRGKMP